MIMVPPLIMLMTSRGFPQEHIIKVAIATSLATILFTSISSVRAHHERGGVQWPIVAKLAPGICVGTLITAQIAGLLNTRWLTIFFGLFVGYSAIKMLQKNKNAGAETKPMPKALGLFGVGGVIGGLSALVGAGGGFMTVPFLANRGLTMQHAVASSAACGFPIALAGAIGYIIAGWNVQIAPYTAGYIYLPALFMISLASVITAPIGAKTAANMPMATLKKFFGFMLMALATYMMWRGLAA